MNNHYFNESFNFSQYESITNKFDFTIEVEARYIRQINITYDNNLLIEALPSPFKDPVSIYKWLNEKINYSESELKLSKFERKDIVFRLEDFFLPLPNNLLVCEYLDATIRKGYTSKRLFSPEYLSDLRNLTGFDLESLKCIINSGTNSAVGFSIIGKSGAGKSTAINKALYYYPRVIRHRNINGLVCLFTQITYIKIECSHDATLKSICIQFFKSVDEILGTGYENSYGNKRNSVEYMMGYMAHLSIQYAIGVLIIDEIQNIGNSVNGQMLVNFFVKLSNETKVPIVYIGTNDAFDTLLFKEFKQSRRANGRRIIQFNPLYGEEWNTFIKKLWKYQWTNIKTPLSSELVKCLYQCTAGIIDSVIHLFVAVQGEAIEMDSIISIDLILRVNIRDFAANISKIKAILDNEYKKHREYGDVKPDEINELIKNNISDNDRMLNVTELANSDEENSMKYEILNKLKILGYSDTQMEKAYNYIKDKYNYEFESMCCEDISKYLVKSLLDQTYKEPRIKDKNALDPSLVLNCLSKETF